jgi:hypothetical protein
MKPIEGWFKWAELKVVIQYVCMYDQVEFALHFLGLTPKYLKLGLSCMVSKMKGQLFSRIQKLRANVQFNFCREALWASHWPEEREAQADCSMIWDISHISSCCFICGQQARIPELQDSTYCTSRAKCNIDAISHWSSRLLEGFQCFFHFWIRNLVY